MRRSMLLKAAVIGTMLSSARPMSIQEITDDVLARRPVDLIVGPLTPKRLSDLLRYQARRGLVRRVSRGGFEAVPGSMGRTTRWRYRRWEERYDAMDRLVTRSEALDAPRRSPT